MRRGSAFGLLLLALVAIDSAAVALHASPSTSLGALIGRGIVCMAAGHALTRTSTDAIVAGLLAVLFSVLSLAFSDVAILFSGAMLVVVPGFGTGDFVLAGVVLPLLASAAGSLLALSLARRAAPRTE